MRRPFGLPAPVAQRLRRLPSDRLRPARGAFHALDADALPGSKRYAETPAERAEYRARANRLAEAVLGAPAPIWISTWFLVAGAVFAGDGVAFRRRAGDATFRGGSSMSSHPG